MKENPKIVLSFDLDFTLIDNREGIINSFYYALKKFNLPLIEKAEIVKMIGLPLDQMFESVSNLEPSKLSASFREYYGAKGIYQAILFPGAREKVEELKNSFNLGIITSKKQEIAVKLLKFLDFAKHFDYILGETDQIKSKKDHKIKEYLFNIFPNHRFVIIGDHPKDKELAKMLDCPFIGVLTGNHTSEDLKVDGSSTVIILYSIRDITPDLIYSLF
jgi:phosphoglycolate phosphatase